MEITINNRQLQGALGLAAAMAERKTTIPILANVLLSAEGNALTLTGTDLETALRTSVEAAVAKSGSITLPAKRFFDYVRLLPAGESVTIKSDAKHWATLTCGRAKTRIAGIHA